MRLKPPKYYDVTHLLKDYPDCLYYVVFGERSNGKTYSALKYCLERYFKHGEQFAYIRRFGEDVKKKNLQTLFSAHVEHGLISEYTGGAFTSIEYGGNKFIPVNWTTGAKGADLKEVAKEPIGYAFDLNAVEHHKSTSFPKITTIVFDEFLSRQGYLTNEFVLFMNTLSTIIRDRNNVKIFMIGNTVNRYCPYFTEMGLTHIKNQKPGTCDVYHYADTGLSVCVEYCDPMSKRGGKSSDMYFAFDNPQLQMITSGSWEIAIYPHMEYKYRPKDVVYMFFVKFDDTMLQCEIICDDNGIYMFVHPKTSDLKYPESDFIFTNRPSQRWNWITGFNASNPLVAKINSLIAENKVFYSDNETGEVMRNFIAWSKQYSAVKGGR